MQDKHAEKDHLRMEINIGQSSLKIAFKKTGCREDKEKKNTQRVK